MESQAVMYLARLTQRGQVSWGRLDEYGTSMFRTILQRPGGGSRILRLAELADGSWALLYGTRVIQGDEINLILAPAVKSAIAKDQLSLLLERIERVEIEEKGDWKKPLTVNVLQGHIKRQEELAGMR